MQMSLAEFIENKGGYPRATYAAAEDAFWRSLTLSLSNKDTSEAERERLNKLHDSAYQAMKGAKK
jgi:hypothetical protein